MRGRIRKAPQGDWEINAILAKIHEFSASCAALAWCELGRSGRVEPCLSSVILLVVLCKSHPFQGAWWHHLMIKTASIVDLYREALTAWGIIQNVYMMLHNTLSSSWSAKAATSCSAELGIHTMTLTAESIRFRPVCSGASQLGDLTSGSLTNWEVEKQCLTCLLHPRAKYMLFVLPKQNHYKHMCFRCFQKKQYKHMCFIFSQAKP